MTPRGKRISHRRAGAAVGRGGASRPRLAGAILAAILLVGACASNPGVDRAGAGQPSSREDPALLPSGFGTLRQDDVTLTLRSGDLLIKVTPLDPAVIRALATDTWQRLRGLREGHGPELVRRSGIPDPDLFLVSFFSYDQQVPYEPEDVHLVNRGLRFRPLVISSVTPGWGRQRLSQEETQMAVYAFEPGLDLDQDLAAEYQDARAGGWERMLQEIQAERARIRARSRSMP